MQPCLTSILASIHPTYISLAASVKPTFDKHKMASIVVNDQKPHAVCIPYPAQGHISPMLKLAKILHQRGFYITFVNTEYNHRRLIKSRGLAAVEGLPDFRFATIPDGLPESDNDDVTQETAVLCESTSTTCLESFYELLLKLNGAGMDVPKVSCIVADGSMAFTLKAADRLGVPEAILWTASACGLLAYTHFKHLVEGGYVPLKDPSQITDGYLETVIDWVPGLKDFKLRDFPASLRTTDPEDFMLNFVIQECEVLLTCRALIINTFDTLEREALEALSSMFPSVYTIGPLQLMINYASDERLNAIDSSLWKEDSECLKWLDSHEPDSVVYVNFGSITVVTAQQLTEFAWGLANSKKAFLWIIRPDLVKGDSAMLPPEFVVETKDRSMVVSWCVQEQVLKHPAIGGFLTHCGWNSTIESIVGGVPMVCWPFFAEQQTNCRYSCVEWEIGMEIDNDVKRDEVEVLVKELMDGEKGTRMKEKAKEWKRKAEEATLPGGSSYSNLEEVIKNVLLQQVKI